MQIGIDLGATKIEYVLLDNNNKELKRDRVQTPQIAFFLWIYFIVVLIFPLDDWMILKY